MKGNQAFWRNLYLQHYGEEPSEHLTRENLAGLVGSARELNEQASSLADDLASADQRIEELEAERESICSALYAAGIPSASEDGYGENAMRMEALLDRIKLDRQRIEGLEAAGDALEKGIRTCKVRCRYIPMDELVALQRTWRRTRGG